MLMKENKLGLSNAGLGNLLVVYIIWSSTYLAIRIMVAPGGFSVWTAGSIRMVLAGVLLFAFGWLRGYRIKISRRELIMLFITGNLLWPVCNGMVMWVEQSANSGFAALVLASTPIWTAFIDCIADRKKPSLLLIGSLIMSFAGITVLVLPSMANGRTTQLTAGIVLTLAAIAWSGGSVVQTRYPLKMETSVISAYQHLFGAFGFIIAALATGQHLTQASHSAWLALGYLILFGSVLGFTSFISALKLLPINIAMTYAYVNPVLALILGWWLLHETLTIWTLIGAAMVIMGVVGVFREKYNANKMKRTENVLTD